MKKLITSSLILLFLILVIWALAAWIMRVKTEQTLKAFMQATELQNNSIVEYKLIEYQHSIFSAEAKLMLQFNESNSMAQFIKGVLSNKAMPILSLNISHGPILFKRSGLTVGLAAWRFKAIDVAESEDSSSDAILWLLNQLVTAQFMIDFENTLRYQIPLQLNAKNSLKITGHYNLKTHIHKGQVTSNSLFYQALQGSIQTSAAELYYRQLATQTNQKSHFEFTAKLPQVTYRHHKLTKNINLKLDYSGDISFNNTLLNSNNKILLDFENLNKDSRYPIEQGILKVDLTDLNLHHLTLLTSTLDQIQALQQQSQWILESQGEYPEGQDQIRKAQDNVSKLDKQLPSLINNVVYADINNQQGKKKSTENNPSIRFSLTTNTENKQSSLSGAIRANQHKQALSHFGSSTVSLSALIQAEAQVSLDDLWFKVLSSRLPIKKPNFKLVYRQNKLLMQ